MQQLCLENGEIQIIEFYRDISIQQISNPLIVKFIDECWLVYLTRNTWGTLSFVRASDPRCSRLLVPV